jgi:NTP pyrophosphatase (non-canonical NTP hydrolase)
MTHPTLVASLCKDGQEIKKSLSPMDCHLWHMASKLCSEAGELMDCVGKAVIYRKPIDLENAIEELGDIEFYLEGIRQGLNFSREQCIERNIKKLMKRYGERYSDEAAIERKDKQ